MTRLLTAEARTALVQRVFWAGTREQLRAVEQEIARNYAATPEQKRQNEAELSWLRNVVSARRQHVGRDGGSVGDGHGSAAIADLE